MERLKIISSDVSLLFESQLNSFLESLDSDGLTYTINFQKDSEYKHCAYVLYSVVPPKKEIPYISGGYCRFNCTCFEDRGTEGFCRYHKKKIQSHRVLCQEAFSLEGAVFGMEKQAERARC